MTGEFFTYARKILGEQGKMLVFRLKAKHLNSCISLYNKHGAINNSKKYIALPSIRYCAHGRGIYKGELWRIQKKKFVGKPSEKNDVSNFLCYF